LSTDSPNPLARFDPNRVAHYETENYIAYYQRRWGKLLLVSIGMVKEFFHLNPFQAIFGAYLIARAEAAAAPFPDNDIPTAEAYIRRFYALVKRIHHASFDVEQTAHWEVNWWVVHRRLFGKEDNLELVLALMKLYAAAYERPADQFKQAAYRRARGMFYSDQWVNSGKPTESPLLTQVESELAESYKVLKNVLMTG
jgi:hypothetical protein